MRDFFLIKHHPRGLTEAYQENARRTRAPRHTLPACAGRYDDEGVISLRQRVVNGMQSEGRVVSHLTEVNEQGDRTILTRLLILSHSAFSAASTKTPAREAKSPGARSGARLGVHATAVGQPARLSSAGHEPTCRAPALPHWSQGCRFWIWAIV
jgi:hypothetical protein